MRILLITLCALVLQRVQASDEGAGGCPLECDCRFVPPGPETHWTGGSTAFCVFANDTIDSLFDLQTDTESLTILQDDNDTHLTVTHDMLVGFQRLRAVDLQGSPTGHIRIAEDLFSDMPDLRRLHLRRVDLGGAEKAFARLPHLEALHAAHCDLGRLRWEMLDGLRSLRELHLVQSGVKELGGFAFYGAPELRRLHLQHNDLFSVEADAFVGLLKLEHLDLSNNRIGHLSGLTFPPLPHLQWLELKHNPIRVIFPHCFRYLEGTQHLTLGHREQPVHLMRFSFRGLFSLLFLHIPNIDNDALFEHMFYDLRSLLHLRLSGRVKAVGNRAFNGAHRALTRLVLHDCQLEKLSEDAFHGLERLEALDLSDNLLQSLPEGSLRHLPSLRILRLTNNRLRQVPDALLQPPQLRALGLGGNPWHCTCAMARWRPEAVLAAAENATCGGGACAEGHLEEEGGAVEPKCQDPPQYRNESVFRVLKMLDCATP